MAIYKNADIDTYPLAINILKLQRYNFEFFSLPEAAFFEYMIVKAQSFKFKWFYHSAATITEETGIRKHELKTITTRFSEELGIIEVKVEGFPLVTHYKVSFRAVLKHLSSIYKINQFANNGKLLAEFFQLLAENSQEKNTNKNIKKENLDKKGILSENKFSNEIDIFSKEESSDELKAKKAKTAAAKKERARKNDEARSLSIAPGLQTFLNEIYKERLVMHNKNPGDSRKKSFVNLAYSKDSKMLLCELHKTHDDNQIRCGFTAFIDDVIEGNLEISKPIPYFLKKNKDGDFDTFLTYLDKFIVNYGHK